MPAKKKPKKKTAAKRQARSNASNEPTAAAKRRATRIYNALNKAYPDAKCALTHGDPWQLLVATILSAQCTDKRVNMVTPTLFETYPTPADLAKAPQAKVEKLIQSTGFFRNKAKSIRGAAKKIANEHNGDVPSTMDELTDLPGVARKTANVVLGNAMDKNEGVVVDTHVKRLAFRLGLTEQTTPEKVERDLMALFPKKNWTLLSHLLIDHGRAVCNARKPACSQCPLANTCDKLGVDNAA